MIHHINNERQAMKTVKQNNYRVVIEPRRLGDFGFMSTSDGLFCSGEDDRQAQYRERCEEIAQDVKRHVDQVGSVSVESDQYSVCAHCGANWTEIGSDYNGGCCAADELAHTTQQESEQK